MRGSIGHLGIFVSGGVARKERKEFATNMDMADVLPPGLHEAVLRPAKKEARPELAGGGWFVNFHSRDFADLAQHGGTDPEDEKRLAAVRRVSETNLALHREFAQPVVCALATPPVTRARAPSMPASWPW